MSSKVRIVLPEELKAMSTGTLLSRRNKLLQCEESFNRSDRCGYEDPPDAFNIGYIEFKDQPQWTCAYQQIKNILATREHVPGAIERKTRRMQQPKKTR